MRQLVKNALSLNTHFVAEHIPGVHNSIADALSSVSVGQVPWVGTGSRATRESLPIGTLERGLGIVDSLVQRSVSMGTWQAYSRKWRNWEEQVGRVGGCRSEEEFESVLLYFIARRDKLFSGLSSFDGL